MYNSWGFTKLIKLKDIDHHNIDSNGNPKPVGIPTALFLFKIEG